MFSTLNIRPIISKVKKIIKTIRLSRFGTINSMESVSNEHFEKLINESMDELPQEYIEGLNNVVIIYEDEPTPAQRQQLKLRCNQSLFGLYEGIPRTKRGAGYMFVVPDKITIFKKPMEQYVSSLPELKEQVKRTLWHEIAHHYGLDHDRIHHLESKDKPDPKNSWR